MSLLVDATFNNLPYRITIPDSEFPIFCHYPLLNKDFRSFLLSKNLYSLCTLDAFCECRHCAVTKFLRMQFQFLIPQIIFHSYFLSDSTSLTFVFVIRCHRNINLYFSFKPLCTICLWEARWKGNGDKGGTEISLEYLQIFTIQEDRTIRQ